MKTIKFNLKDITTDLFENQLLFYSSERNLTPNAIFINQC